MESKNFDFDTLKPLLGLSIDDPLVRDFFGATTDFVERDEFTGSLEFKSEGIGVSFEEAPWVLSPQFINDPTALYINGIFFYGEGRDGYTGYSGELPNGVLLGDHVNDIILKMGKPDATGGGTSDQFGFTQLWYRYFIDNANLSFDFDASGEVNLICVSIPIITPFVSTA